MINNGLKVKIKSSEVYTNNMTVEQSPIRENARKLNSSSIKPQKDKIEQNDNTFVIQFMNWILNESYAHQKYHDHSGRSE